MNRRSAIVALLMVFLLVTVQFRTSASNKRMDLPRLAESEIHMLPPTDQELPSDPQLSPSGLADNPPLPAPVEAMTPVDQEIQRLPPPDIDRLPPTDDVTTDRGRFDRAERESSVEAAPLLDTAPDDSASNSQAAPGEIGIVSTPPEEKVESVESSFGDATALPEALADSAPEGRSEPAWDDGSILTTPGVGQSSEFKSDSHSFAKLADLPDAVAPAWWRTLVTQPMRSTSDPKPISLEQMIASAVCYSDQLRVYSDTPLIRDMIVVEEDAAFDWVGFTETMWNDINEPVGSTLTTGGPPRLQDEQVESRFGLRRRSTSGGRFELSQEFGHQNSNSVFFQPNNQGTSQLTLNYTQPLMRGAGRVYNSSLIVLAQIDAGVARDEFSSQLQTYLLDVTNAYWTLFQQRATLLQKERLFKRGQDILENLENRSGIDALASQIVRARAAVSIRRASLYRAATQVKNAESRIRALVNAPQLGLADQFELLPVDAPGLDRVVVGMPEAMTLAIQNRPELHQAVKRIKAAAIRKNMSANELLPIFDLILETYVRGLRGNSEVLESFGDAFSDGSPSYTAGFQMELPLGNRAARASMRRREIELRQLQSQFRATVDVLQLEVEVVVREVHTAFQEIVAKYQSMKAAEHEVEYLTQRWRVLSGEDRSASLLLEDLLAAQERLANEEFGYVEAQIAYNQALTDLKQVTGALLQVEEIDVNIQPGQDGNPVLRPMKRRSFPNQQVAGYEVSSDQAVGPILSKAAPIASH